MFALVFVFWWLIGSTTAFNLDLLYRRNAHDSVSGAVVSNAATLSSASRSSGNAASPSSTAVISLVLFGNPANFVVSFNTPPLSTSTRTATSTSAAQRVQIQVQTTTTSAFTTQPVARVPIAPVVATTSSKSSSSVSSTSKTSSQSTTSQVARQPISPATSTSNILTSTKSSSTTTQAARQPITTLNTTSKTSSSSTTSQAQRQPIVPTLSSSSLVARSSSSSSSSMLSLSSSALSQSSFPSFSSSSASPSVRSYSLASVSPWSVSSSGLPAVSTLTQSSSRDFQSQSSSSVISSTFASRSQTTSFASLTSLLASSSVLTRTSSAASGSDSVATASKSSVSASVSSSAFSLLSSARSSASRSSSSASSNSASRASSSTVPKATISGLPGNVLYSDARCLYDTSSKRTLNSSSYYQGSSSNTLQSCALYCFQNGYSLAGAEYSTECYCSNGLASTTTSTACTMACSGNSTEICGGSNALTVVNVNPNYNTLDPNAANGYQGCFVDGQLLNATFRTGAMTVELCSNYCSGIGYEYSGTEYGTNCYCGASGSVPINLTPATACYSACYGNSSEDCGGNGLQSIYKNTPDLSFAVPYTDAGKTSSSAANIFAALPASAPSSNFPQRPHDILPQGITSSGPIHTNKQYSQAFYSSREQILTMIPYIVNYIGNAFAVQHSDANQYTVSGTATNGIGASSYGGPLAQQQITFSSLELLSGQAVNMTADSSLHASVNLSIYPLSNPSTNISMPLVNGMGLVTAHYTGLIPIIQSPNVKISTFSSVTAPIGSGIAQKLKFQLGDSSTWVMYLIPDAGSSTNLVFSRNATYPNNLVANGIWSGTMQTAKLTTVSDAVQGEATLDQAAGTWVTSMELSGSTSGSSGSYAFNYVKAGNTAKSPLVFALPHHLEVITNGGATGLQMQSPITGIAQGYITDSLTMSEPELPSNIGFVTTNSEANWSNDTLLSIKKAITPDILSNSAAGCNEYSTYFSGKCLAKWGQLCMIAKDIVQDPTLTATCTSQFAAVLNTFVANAQDEQLTYETSWKGLVATSGFATVGDDFGATDYNDHHFHYGYIIYASAVMGYLDSTWLTATNIDWVNTLVRDVSNPSESDPYFPQFRMMDWYVGHSVAHGVRDDEAAGKDQESSSEDYNYSYGLKLWGHVTGNANLEGLGNMMCAVNMRSMNNYILLGPTNKNVPQAYAVNYANGVTFGNSMSYFTYFGAQTQYVNGIHMLPLTPISPYIRTASFVQGEWNSLLAPLFSQLWNTGWAGILYSNLAISDPQTSWNFFNNGSVVDFNYYNLDDGQSLSWALTFAAGLGGGQ